MVGRGGNNFAGKTEEEMKEIRRKISEANSGEKHPFYGKKRPEISERMSGENHPMYGKHHSEKTKQKMSENHADFSGKNHPRARKVVLLNTGEIYESCGEAGRQTGVAHQSISANCNGGQKSAGLIDGKPGIWMYYSDYEKLSKEEIDKIKNQELPNRGRPAKAVICVTTEKIYESTREAERQTGVNHGIISKSCKGEVKSAGKHPETGEKLVWMYYDEYLESL